MRINRAAYLSNSSCEQLHHFLIHMNYQHGAKMVSFNHSKNIYLLFLSQQALPNEKKSRQESDGALPMLILEMNCWMSFSSTMLELVY